MSLRKNKASIKKTKLKGSKKASRRLKAPSAEFTILKKRLEEAIELKLSGNYLDRDFDALVDKL